MHNLLALYFSSPLLKATSLVPLVPTWRSAFGILSLASLSLPLQLKVSEGARSSSHPSYCFNFFHSFASNQAVSRHEVVLAYNHYGYQLRWSLKLAYMSL